jgi:hypothetical protein
MTQRVARRDKLAQKGRMSKDKVVTKSEVRAMIRSNNNLVVEDKVTYTQQTGGVDFTGTGTVFDLCAALSRGDAAIDQFTGQQLNPISLTIRLGWNTTQAFSTCRLMVFQWADASVPVASGLYQFLGTNLAPYSPLFWTNHPKIHVLCDETTTIFPVAGSQAATNMILRCNKMKKIYFDATAAVSYQMNGLYAVAVSDDGIAAYPQLDFISELRFQDA